MIIEINDVDRSLRLARKDASATMLIDLAFAELIFSSTPSRPTPAMPCSVEGVVDRDARKQNEVRPPTTRAAMERREAPGLLARARAPRDPHLPQAPWVPESWRVAGSRKPGRGGLANLLGASRRSIPLLWRGEGKQGDGRSRASEKQNPGTAERWLIGLFEQHDRCHSGAGP